MFPAPISAMTKSTRLQRIYYIVITKRIRNIVMIYEMRQSEFIKVLWVACGLRNVDEGYRRVDGRVVDYEMLNRKVFTKFWIQSANSFEKLWV